MNKEKPDISTQAGWKVKILYHTDGEYVLKSEYLKFIRKTESSLRKRWKEIEEKDNQISELQAEVERLKNIAVESEKLIKRIDKIQSGSGIHDWDEVSHTIIELIGCGYLNSSGGVGMSLAKWNTIDSQVKKLIAKYEKQHGIKPQIFSLDLSEGSLCLCAKVSKSGGTRTAKKPYLEGTIKVPDFVW